MPSSKLSSLSADPKLAAEWLPTLEAIALKRRRRKIDGYFQDAGELRRELYPKHLKFFAAGAESRERAFVAANRVGKTEAGAYEVACHLTGEYPPWWAGRRFTRRTRIWACGDTAKTVRQIVQAKLLGEPGAIGTGMIPAAAIQRTTAGSGVPDAIDTAVIAHKSGGVSLLTFKSYDQRRESFQGTEQDLVWLDEEPPLEIYSECLIRTMTTAGMIMLTFTPLLGLSEVVLQFMPGGQLPTERTGSRAVVFCTWDDVPHLSVEVKNELWGALPAHQRQARSKGIPQLGSGAIYPVAEEDFVEPDFAIPAHWPRAFGLDVGWNRTAAIWGALDRETDVLHLYSEHYRGEADPVVHSHAIRARGAWIPGVIDPASRGRGQADGKQLIQAYVDLGLDLDVADNAVEAGIHAVWTRMTTGRLRVAKSLGNTLEELRLYRRDDKGRVVKERDHLMDAMRYLVLSGVDRAKCQPAKREEAGPLIYGSSGGSGWMG